MRAIPAELQDRLDSGVTTLCRCWRITRRDGVVQGFTDHDEDVLLDGIVCRAGTGLTGSEATHMLGLAVGGSEISGALSDAALGEDDLAAGLYDAAAIEVWLVDWSAPHLFLLLAKGVLGEVRRDGLAFTAELRGLSHRLAEESGRLFTATCAADLGDARCGIDLNDPAFRGGGTVTALLATAAFTASGLSGFADGRFTGGRLTFDSGANAGLSVEVKTHRAIDAVVTLTLWQAMPQPLAADDAFTVTAGCDKRFETCVGRFSNAVNFRGFPHIPGNDFIVRYPVQGEPGNDGSSLRA
jgi:uncharacterized phage protein (TIGR02218 family)